LKKGTAHPIRKRKGARLDAAKNIPPIIYLNADNVLHHGLTVPPEK
jgi:hypothetical protein